MQTQRTSSRHGLRWIGSVLDLARRRDVASERARLFRIDGSQPRRRRFPCFGEPNAGRCALRYAVYARLARHSNAPAGCVVGAGGCPFRCRICRSPRRAPPERSHAGFGTLLCGRDSSVHRDRLAAGHARRGIPRRPGVGSSGGGSDRCMQPHQRDLSLGMPGSAGFPQLCPVNDCGRHSADCGVTRPWRSLWARTLRRHPRFLRGNAVRAGGDRVETDAPLRRRPRTTRTLRLAPRCVVKCRRRSDNPCDDVSGIGRRYLRKTLLQPRAMQGFMPRQH